MSGPGLDTPLDFALGELAEVEAFPALVDHPAQGVDRLLQQFAASPNLQGIVSALLQGQQDVAATLHATLTDRGLSGAGHRVDLLASLQAFTRDGRSDAATIALYVAWVAARLSSGTAPDIYRVLEYAVPGGVYGIHHLELDRGLHVSITSPPMPIEPASADDMDPTTAGRLMREARGKGLRLWLETVPVESPEWLLTIGDYTETGPSAHGLSDDYESPTFGGHLSRMEVH